MSAGDTSGELLVGRFYDELWNRWQLQAADEILAARIRFRGSLGFECEDREEVKRYVEIVRAAFPDWHSRVEEMIVADGRVVTRLTWSGTHRGRFGRLEPTGARVEFPGAGFFRIADGLIDEAWIVGDTWAMWRALGSGLEPGPLGPLS